MKVYPNSDDKKYHRVMFLWKERRHWVYGKKDEFSIDTAANIAHLLSERGYKVNSIEITSKEEIMKDYFALLDKQVESK